MTEQAAERARGGGRIELARVAREAALALPDVLGSDAGRTGLHSTTAGRERVPGVVVLPEADGRCRVELHLVARLVPLAPLGARVRERVAAAAEAASLADGLGPVDIVFEDVEERES